jgi:transcriptional regulator with XRE-family HTH domain
LYVNNVSLPAHGQLLKLLRTTTQARIAATIGAKQQMVSAWKRGKGIPNAFYQQALKNAYGISEAGWLTPEQVLALRALKRDEARRAAMTPRRKAGRKRAATSNPVRQEAA